MRNRAVRFALIAPAAIAAIFLFGYVVELLWNHALVPATGWHEVTYWQAVGLLVLTKIFFGFRGGPGRGHWRHRMRERWEKMTPEQRQKFEEAMRARCGSFRAYERPQEPQP